MATTVRSSSINTTSGSAVTVAAPAGTTTGDVVIVIVSCNGNTTIVDNNGSTPFTEDLNDFQETVGGETVSVFSRRIVGGDPSTYAFTTGLSGRWTAVAVTFQSPHASVIYDVAPDTANSSAFTPNTTAPTSDAITTINANALHVIAVLPDGPATAVSGTPAGYTILQNGGDQTIAAGYLLIASPGSTGVQTWTTALEDSVTLSFAIRDIGSAVVRTPYTPWPQMGPILAQKRKGYVGWNPLYDNRRRVLRPNRSLLIPDRKIIIRGRRAA